MTWEEEGKPEGEGGGLCMPGGEGGTLATVLQSSPHPQAPTSAPAAGATRPAGQEAPFPSGVSRRVPALPVYCSEPGTEAGADMPTPVPLAGTVALTRQDTVPNRPPHPRPSGPLEEQLSRPETPPRARGPEL